MDALQRLDQPDWTKLVADETRDKGLIRAGVEATNEQAIAAANVELPTFGNGISWETCRSAMSVEINFIQTCTFYGTVFGSSVL